MKSIRWAVPILIYTVAATGTSVKAAPGNGESKLVGYWSTPVVQEGPLRARGDYRIERGEVIRRDLIVEGGTLTVDGEVRGWVVVTHGDAFIRGTVQGLVVVLYGDVMVLDSGLVQGDAVSVEGDVIIRGSGVVTGSKWTTTRQGLERQGRDVDWARVVRQSGVLGREEELEREWPRRERDWDVDWDDRWNYRRWTAYEFAYTGDFPLGWVCYNRVDGLTVQGEIFNSQHDWGSAATSFYGGAGYAFASKEFYYRLGLNRFFFPGTPIELGISMYRQLDTEDAWYITPNENDLNAFLARYDWYDYYRVEGMQAHLRFRPQRWLQLGVRYAQDTEMVAERVTNWSIFGGDRVFRENEWLTTYDQDPDLREYSIADEGEIRRLVYFVRLDLTSGSSRRPTRGVVVDATLEKAEHQGIDAGDPFTYERLLIKLEAYQRLSRIDHLALRVRVGSSTVETSYAIPVQHRYYMGGVGSLRGYDFKQFNGNRLFLGTLEYTLGADGSSPFFGGWALTFFYDYGLAWDADPEVEIDKELTPGEAVRSIGAAIAPFGWGGMRIEVAKPLDTEEKELTYYIRWSFDF